MTFRPLLTTPYSEQHLLQGRPVADVELALADAGIVVQPVVRKANMDALLARAVARNAT